MTPLPRDDLVIRTPEGIDFSLVLAGPVPRALALTLDRIVVVVIFFVLQQVLTPFAVLSPDLAVAAVILTYFAVDIGYAMFLEWFWRGQTLGKRVLHLRVMDEEALRLRFSQVAVRNLLRFVDFLPGLYLLGGLAAAISRRRQRLGDLAAGTIVIREPRVGEPDIQAALAAGKYNSFRELPHVAARLRQRTTPAEAAVALHALLRRDRLEPEARRELFAAVAGQLRRLAEFPPHLTEGLSDEQYVRNAVEVLYATGAKGLADEPGGR